MTQLYNFIYDHILIIGLIVAAVCALIELLQTKGKYKLFNFFCTIALIVIPFFVAQKADEETSKMQEAIDNYAVGGFANYPLIQLGRDSGKYQLMIVNPSDKLTLYDIDCNMIQVSAARKIINYFDKTVGAGRFDMIRPTDGKFLQTSFGNGDSDKSNLEWRYNFFINCRNGYFKEQIIIRKIDNMLVCLVRIKKDGKLIYETPNLKRYRFPGETNIEFQHEMLGVDMNLPDPVFEKLKEEYFKSTGKRMVNPLTGK